MIPPIKFLKPGVEIDEDEGLYGGGEVFCFSCCFS